MLNCVPRCGATGQSQRRGAAVQIAMTALASSAVNGTAATTSQAISADMIYLRMVADALGGSATNLDVTPLDWREVEELVQESYRLVAPKRLKT